MRGGGEGVQIYEGLLNVARFVLLIPMAHFVTSICPLLLNLVKLAEGLAKSFTLRIGEATKQNSIEIEAY
jgi:hypothetical protein